MTAVPLYLTLGVPSGSEVLSRLRDGRRKALASVGTRFIVSCRQDGTVRKVIFDRQPTAQDILEKLGQNAVVVGVEFQRAPVRVRPQMFE